MNEENKTNLENTSNNNEVLSNGGVSEVDHNQNDDNINNIPLNEMEAPGTTLGVNPPSENVEVNLNNNSSGDNSLNQKNNKKKIIIIVSVVVGVIILAIIAMFVYIKVVFDAGKYLDEKINEFTTNVNETFASLNLSNENQTYRYSGSLTPNTNIEGLTSINDATFNFDLMYDANILDLNFDIMKNSESIFDGELYLDSNRFYINSADLYPSPIYAEVDANVGDVQASVEELTRVFGQLNYLVINFVDYFGEALKEAEVNTKINGLTASYTYVVNDENKEAFVSKFNELVENDAQFQEAINALNAEVVMDTDTLENFAIEVVVKIPSSDVKSFNFVTEEDTIIQGEELDNGVFRVTFEDAVIDITTNDNDTNITWQIDDSTNLDVTYNSENGTINGSITSDTSKLDMNMASVGDNEYSYNIILNDTTQDVNAEVNLTIKDEDNKMTGSGDITIEANSENLGFDFTLTVEYLSDPVEEKTFSGAVLSDTLTDEQTETISNNLSNILTILIPDLEEYFLLPQLNEARGNTLALEANSVITSAQAYYLSAGLMNDNIGFPSNPGETRCITVAELINGGYSDLDPNEYSGKVVVKKGTSFYENQYFYSVYLQKGNELMVIGAGSNVSDIYLETPTQNMEVTSSDVIEYDPTIFNQYMICS